jgi:hypothetical protein
LSILCALPTASSFGFWFRKFTFKVTFDGVVPVFVLYRQRAAAKTSYNKPVTVTALHYNKPVTATALHYSKPVTATALHYGKPELFTVFVTDI